MISKDTDYYCNRYSCLCRDEILLLPCIMLTIKIIWTVTDAKIRLVLWTLLKWKDITPVTTTINIIMFLLQPCPWPTLMFVWAYLMKSCWNGVTIFITIHVWSSKCASKFHWYILDINAPPKFKHWKGEVSLESIRMCLLLLYYVMLLILNPVFLWTNRWSVTCCY